MTPFNRQIFVRCHIDQKLKFEIHWFYKLHEQTRHRARDQILWSDESTGRGGGGNLPIFR